jgi:thiamine biosynthesis protein ThiI
MSKLHASHLLDEGYRNVGVFRPEGEKKDEKKPPKS